MAQSGAKMHVYVAYTAPNAQDTASSPEAPGRLLQDKWSVSIGPLLPSQTR